MKLKYGLLALLLTGCSQREPKIEIPPTIEEAPPITQVTAMGEIAYEKLHYIQDNLPYRIAFTANEWAMGDWIIEKLEEIGLTPQVQEFSMADFEFTDFLQETLSIYPYSTLERVNASRNIMATITGASEEIIIVGAHYDSLFTRGIADNGASIALLLELAKRLAEEELPYTVKFVFFGAEEFGLLGAEYFVRTMPEHVKLMVNADPLFDSEVLNFSVGALDENGIQVHNKLSESILETAQELELDLVFQPNGILIPSDNLPFVRKGLTTLALFGVDVEIDESGRLFPAGTMERTDVTLSQFEQEGAYHIRQIIDTPNDNLPFIQKNHPHGLERALYGFGRFLEAILRR